jgi:hypothetical protein
MYINTYEWCQQIYIKKHYNWIIMSLCLGRYEETEMFTHMHLKWVKEANKQAKEKEYY